MYDYKDSRYSDFTYCLSSTSTLTESSVVQQFTFLLTYHPHFNIWKEFQIVCGGKPFKPIESAVYLRDPTGRYIYVIGGCNLKVESKIDYKFPSHKKEVTNLNTCFAINLSKVNIFEPSKSFQKAAPLMIRMKVSSPNSPTKPV